MKFINIIGTWFEKITGGWKFGTPDFLLTFKGNVEVQGGSGGYTHTYQNKDGTLAHLSDIEDVIAALRPPYTPFKFLQKGYGNTDLEIYEVGDIFSGWSNDGTTRYAEDMWNGIDITNSDNFTPLVTIEM